MATLRAQTVGQWYLLFHITSSLASLVTALYICSVPWHSGMHTSPNPSPFLVFLKDETSHHVSVPLRTGTCYIRDIFVLFLQGYCALQELIMKMNFILSVAPPSVHSMTSLPAMPTHSVWKYGFFSEPARQRQVAKCGNLKRCESLSFSGDIESLDPSKF